MVMGDIVVSNDDFAECIADCAQRTVFLFPFCIIGDLIGGLDIIPAMSLIGHEIHFQILTDLPSVRIKTVIYCKKCLMLNISPESFLVAD